MIYLKVSTSTWVLDSRIGYEKSICLLKDAGFDSYDLTICSGNKDRDALLYSDNYADRATALRNYADKVGLPCNQAHAPFPSSVGDAKKDKEIFDNIVRSMEISSILGADIIVIHPMQHLNYAEHARELFDMNVKFYKALIPYAEKFSIKIATENMWQLNNPSQVPSDSVCSRAWEFCELIDSVNSKWLIGCLDIGHASLMGTDIPEFIKKMGNDRLCALHVHDTDLAHDSHTLPFTLNIDYEAVAKALGEIDYKGDFTFEAGMFLYKFPEELLPSALKLMCDTGRYIASRIDTYRP